MLWRWLSRRGYDREIAGTPILLNASIPDRDPNSGSLLENWTDGPSGAERTSGRSSSFGAVRTTPMQTILVDEAAFNDW